MTEDKTRRAESESSNIEEILQQRERLERILQDKYSKEVTILFSDICGYTEYIDARGDVNGRALLFKHNRLVLPQIEQHGGRVIEIVGDAVMAAFSEPLSAVSASIAIQKALNEHNLKARPEDRITVKIGINLGEVLVDDAAVYQGFSGDVANVASRVQSRADSEQILISKATYERVRGSDDVLCRFQGTAQVKGKSEPLEIYRVVWRDEDADAVTGTEPKVRLREPLVRKPFKVLQLEVNRDQDRLRVSAHERTSDEESAIRNYEKMPVSMDRIEARCREIIDTLNRANRHGHLTREVLVKLREVGQVFYDELFTIGVKRKLQESKAAYLSLNLDDHLVHVPWELLHDGRQFLCQRFNMGRLVRTEQTVFSGRSRELARPLSMLILADPAGDLEGAYKEGTQLRDMMDRDKGLINVFLRSGNITPGFLKEKIRNFDFVHFAGHADYNPQSPEESGWRLTKGCLSAQDVIKMAGTAPMPVLVFSNACQSARTGVWTLRQNFHSEIFGLANAFLLAGVKHYVGTFWEVLDEPSGRFAI
jgi:class 3 adenylate cyclase